MKTEETPKQYAIGTGATEIMWTDRMPYEVVGYRGKCGLVLRAMSATLNPNWKPEVVVGGFSGHTLNNHTQEWRITSNPNGETVTARFTKRGYWASGTRRFSIGTAVRFHDFNF